MTYPTLTESFTYVLLALTEPMHGYGIKQKVERLSGGRVSLGPGTLYGAITNLSDKGWIVERESIGERRRVYALTDKGFEALRHETRRLEELLANCHAQLARAGEESP